jgi:hypothetical protein
MAKREVFVCDKCNKEIEPIGLVKRRLKFTIDIKEDGSGGNNVEFDLCHDCCYTYLEFILGSEMTMSQTAISIRNFIPRKNQRINPR